MEVISELMRDKIATRQDRELINVAGLGPVCVFPPQLVPPREGYRHALDQHGDRPFLRVQAGRVWRPCRFSRIGRSPPLPSLQNDLPGRSASAGVKFAADSLLEGDGFELPVPVRQAKLTRSCR